MNGMEMMLKNFIKMLGLDEHAKRLVDSGAIEKLLKFADEAELIRAELKATTDELARLRAIIIGRSSSAIYNSDIRDTGNSATDAP